jgi:hypothetical protein
MRDRREHVNGPDHYLKAEDYLARVKKSKDMPREDASELLAAAQAHATLALAAATALSHRDDDERMVGMHESDWLAWDKAAGVSPLEVPDGD